MRITSDMYYKNLQTQNSRSNERLFDVNKQISSGLKIQYAKEDVSTFTETMRLDNEMVTLGQIKKSTESGYKVSNQTDTVLNEFETTLNRTRTLLIQVANDATQSSASIDAIANELRGLEKHFKNLANTSINGQYIFSGSAIDTKPIASDGTYMGNDSLRDAFIGNGVKQTYNLSGSELFLGEESNVKKEVSTNVPQYNLIAQHPTDGSDGVDKFITPSDTIRDLMGDTDDATDEVKHHFYVRGSKTDGTSFQTEIKMKDNNTVDELLTQIGNAYGNTQALKIVNVTMNKYGEIVVEDKIKGSSRLDFHMIGAVDFDLDDGDDKADINDDSYSDPGKIGNLDDGETNYPDATDLFVKEFVKSDYSSAAADISKIDGLLYDRTHFTKDGSSVYSSNSQIIKDTNAFATNSRKLSEVSSGSLNGSSFKLQGTDIGGNSYDVDINFNSNGSTFSPDDGTTNYKIFNMDTPRDAVDGDKMTYKQLMDVINMVTTGNYPASENNADDYDNAIETASDSGDVSLSYDGKIKFQDKLNPSTKADIALFDSNSGDFTAASSLMTFNSNNALTIRDPKTDFFKNLDDIITAVENHKIYPDNTSGDTRSVGIENSIEMLDDLMEHIDRSHAKVGTQSNSLTNSLERTQTLEMSTMKLRSSVIDTDLAEASLSLTQLTTNYQAMLSTVSKVSKLSLVNYL